MQLSAFPISTDNFNLLFLSLFGVSAVCTPQWWLHFNIAMCQWIILRSSVLIHVPLLAAVLVELRKFSEVTET